MFKYASANFYTGISGTVVVVGVKRLFVAMLVLHWLFGCVAKRNRQCAKSVGSIATKSMTVKNGGNTIDAVEGLSLCVSHCISRACVLAGLDYLVNFIASSRRWEELSQLMMLNIASTKSARLFLYFK